MLRDANWVQNNTCRAVPKSVVDERLYILPCNLSLYIVKLLAKKLNNVGKASQIFYLKFRACRLYSLIFNPLLSPINQFRVLVGSKGLLCRFSTQGTSGLESREIQVNEATECEPGLSSRMMRKRIIS